MNEILIEQCKYLVDETLPNIANISNLIALLFHEMENINCLKIIFFLAWHLLFLKIKRFLTRFILCKIIVVV